MSEYTLSCAIMHSAFDPERRVAVRELEDQLLEQGADVHWVDFTKACDTKKLGPWSTAKMAWERGLEIGATHHLVLQDDVKVCAEFPKRLLEVISERPDEILSLFCGPRKAFDGTRPWGVMESPWGQGIVMPTDTIRDFLSWEVVNVKLEWLHDDARVGLYCKANRRVVWTPFPTLIDHRDGDLKSVQGNSWNRPRVSPDFLGDRPPPDWSDTERPMRSVNSYTQHDHALIRSQLVSDPVTYSLDDRELVVKAISPEEAKALNQFRPDRKLVSIRPRAGCALYIGGYVNDQLVACAQLVRRGKTTIEFNGDYVRDDYRRCGINAYLVQFRLEAARAAGYSRAITYTTSPSCYMKHGFSIIKDAKEKGPYHTWYEYSL